MVLGFAFLRNAGKKWLKVFVHPLTNDDFEHRPEAERRLYIIDSLENTKKKQAAWVVVVAGVGFFTDAYSIFAINMVIPILGIIYYQDQGASMPHNYEIALSVVTLGGSMLGQIGFGLGADIYGRRKMYGLELIITIGATLGVVMSSNGMEGSMSVIVWLLVWRFVLGIGIGADYPLSAVICAEFAPTKWRGKMMTLVFLCQPIGQLAATLVALIAAARQRNNLPSGSLRTDCTGECLQTLDSMWRWIIGVGVIPAVIALWFRLTIIESPRYTADVARDSRKAANELQNYLQHRASVISSESSMISEVEPLFEGGTNINDFEIYDQPHETPSGHLHVVDAEARTVSIPMEELYQNHGNRPERHSGAQHDGYNIRPISRHDTTLAALAGESSHPLENGADVEAQASDAASEHVTPNEPSWADFKDYFWHQGNLRTLMATSFCWFCVDLPFYGLGMNSPKIISVIWNDKADPPSDVYEFLVDNVWQSLVIVSIGAITGCVLTFITIDLLGRKNIQLSGFFWLFVLFIVIGGSFNHLYTIGDSAVTIVLYVLCQIAFNFGPNTITYILPAELFPTRYRALCHGISGAAGKLGSVIAQLFLAYINYGNGINYASISEWLPYSLLIFSTFMLGGLIVTYFWLDGDRQLKTLEQLEVGRSNNNFSRNWLARIIASTFHFLARIGDKLYLWWDYMSDGEEAERRRDLKEEREATRAREEAHKAGAEEHIRTVENGQLVDGSTHLSPNRTSDDGQ